MTSRSCRPFARRRVDESDLYRSSYDRSYFHENVVDHPLIHVRVTRKAREDLRVRDPVVLATLESVSQAAFTPKYLQGHDSTDFCRRSSDSSRPTLKILHERYVDDPPRPLKHGSTTTGCAYVSPKKPHEPVTWKHRSPVEEFTVPISSHCKEGLPSFSPNESGYGKHLDPYASTSQLTHCSFSEDQQNGVARKNVTTFYDTIGLPKNRGFGPKKSEPFGSYFHRDETTPHRVHPRSVSRVPFSGKVSTYTTHYNSVPWNLTHVDEEIIFPAVYKSFDYASYCTEQCHVGTGWPVRGSVDIGTVQGIY